MNIEEAYLKISEVANLDSSEEQELRTAFDFNELVGLSPESDIPFDATEICVFMGRSKWEYRAKIEKVLTELIATNSIL